MGEISPFGLHFKAQANFRGVRSPKNGNILGNFFQKQNLYIFHLKGSFKSWYVVSALRFKSSLMYMFWAFKLSFYVDILTYFRLLIVLATFSKMWVNFFQSSGHPGLQHCQQFFTSFTNIFAKKLHQWKCRFKLVYIGEVCYGSLTLANF